jgi:hypothetical protein
MNNSSLKKKKKTDHKKKQFEKISKNLNLIKIIYQKEMKVNWATTSGSQTKLDSSSKPTFYDLSISKISGLKRKIKIENRTLSYFCRRFGARYRSDHVERRFCTIRRNFVNSFFNYL